MAKRDKKCATCGSRDPMLHSAVQHEGEVQTCPDQFHEGPEEEIGLHYRTPAADLRDHQGRHPTADLCGLDSWKLAVLCKSLECEIKRRQKNLNRRKPSKDTSSVLMANAALQVMLSDMIETWNNLKAELTNWQREYHRLTKLEQMHEQGMRLIDRMHVKGVMIEPISDDDLAMYLSPIVKVDQSVLFIRKLGPGHIERGIVVTVDEKTGYARMIKTEDGHESMMVPLDATVQVVDLMAT